MIHWLANPSKVWTFVASPVKVADGQDATWHGGWCRLGLYCG